MSDDDRGWSRFVPASQEELSVRWEAARRDFAENDVRVDAGRVAQFGRPDKPVTSTAVSPEGLSRKRDSPKLTHREFVNPMNSSRVTWPLSRFAWAGRACVVLQLSLRSGSRTTPS